MKNKPPTYLTTRDFLVSGREFSLVYDSEKELLATHPQPPLSELPEYYKSENYISHTDANRRLTDRLYQAVKRYSIGQKVRLIKKENKAVGKLLDVGCGTGDFLVEARKKGWEIYGVEPGSEARERCAQKNVFPKEQLHGAVEKDFDVITLWHVLEHLPDLDKQLALLSAKLKPGGTLLVAVPNYRSFDARYYKGFWAAYDVPRHLWHFSKKSIPLLFEPKKLQLLKTKPLWFDAFYVSLLSEKYKNKRGHFVKAMVIGFWSNLMGCFRKEFSSHIYVLRKRAE